MRPILPVNSHYGAANETQHIEGHFYRRCHFAGTHYFADRSALAIRGGQDDPNIEESERQSDQKENYMGTNNTWQAERDEEEDQYPRGRQTKQVV
jgi:hypothetical protein